MPTLELILDPNVPAVGWAWLDDNGAPAVPPAQDNGQTAVVTPGSTNPDAATVGAADQIGRSAPLTLIAAGDFEIPVEVTDSVGDQAFWPHPEGAPGRRQPIFAATLFCQVTVDADGKLVASRKW